MIISRFVRETGYHVCATLISVCQEVEVASEATEDAMDVEEVVNPLILYGPHFSQHLARGLADNWSQVSTCLSFKVITCILVLFIVVCLFELRYFL